MLDSFEIRGIALATYKSDLRFAKFRQSNPRQSKPTRNHKGGPQEIAADGFSLS